MKSFIVFALLVAAAVAAPAEFETKAQIIQAESDNIGLGPYKNSFETSNGIRQQEEGRLADVGTEDEGIEVRGQYSYTGDDGVVYTVTYIADKFGFQPKGSHIPV